LLYKLGMQKYANGYDHTTVSDPALKKKLDQIYAQYNRRQFVDPDPLVYLYKYPEKEDREITGLIASCFAYGQVQQIMKTVDSILQKMANRPRAYVMGRSQTQMANDFTGFVYRFARASHLIDLLGGIKNVIYRFGSLEACFLSGVSPTAATHIPGLSVLCRHLDPARRLGHLLADPTKKSACKRLHLFLRWMVRHDAVDPGGWDQVDQSRLIIPVDRHIYRIGRLLGFTQRKNADLMTAFEITKGFGRLAPDDPVKYDFCLSRFGIRSELTLEDLKQQVYE
jgi:uncharacterized protein (TIGR02757 family)